MIIWHVAGWLGAKTVDGRPEGDALAHYDFGVFSQVPPDAYSQSMALSIGLVLAAILLFVLRAEFLPPEESDWQSAPKRGFMRRRTRGKWEYREMTQDEYDDWLERNAW